MRPRRALLKSYRLVLHSYRWLFADWTDGRWATIGETRILTTTFLGTSGHALQCDSWGKLKKELDKQSGVTGWQVRDLRCTFRSTSARLGISREIAEIMRNHVTGGGITQLDEIYDCYDYFPEKRAALQKLEAHLKK